MALNSIARKHVDVSLCCELEFEMSICDSMWYYRNGLLKVEVSFLS